jgi:hypothetical protein
MRARCGKKGETETQKEVETRKGTQIYVQHNNVVIASIFRIRECQFFYAVLRTV